MSNDGTGGRVVFQTAVQVARGEGGASTAFAELASTLIAAIGRVCAAVPAHDDPRVTKDFITRKLRVPAPFVTAAVTALASDGELRGFNPLSSERTLARKEYIEAFYPLLRRMESATEELRLNIVAQEALLAADAQQIYGVSKALASEREATTLGVHVENMKRAMRRRRTKGSTGADVPEDSEPIAEE